MGRSGPSRHGPDLKPLKSEIIILYTYIYRQIVGPTLFYLSCLRPNLNEIWHEDGPLAPNNRKNTTVQLP